MSVKEQLRSLVELQQIDSKIFEIKRILDRTPSRISEVELPLKESEVAFVNLRQKVSALEKKKRDRERQLEEVIEKINKLKSRISEIKTNKEYQAHLKEIERAEKECSTVEDEILSVMEEIDEAGRQMTIAETNLKKEKDKIESLKKEIGEEMSSYSKDLEKLKEMRAKIAEYLDKEVYDEYIHLIESCDGLAVAEARDEICQGCNMNIPPQLFVELKKTEEIIHCPQCRRILYYKNMDK
ncbi:MAG: C4-type zinc ribbon domain-containing protein [Nitrospirota bacterium]